MTSIVDLKNVSKVIKGRKIIDSLSFQVEEGEVFGFLGPNGAGKTTTIRMIVGLISMSDGDIFICNESVRDQFEKAIQHVGAIVENPEMYKFLSGYENLLHYARMMKGISKEKIMETVELVGLTERIHDKVRTYSLGMRQRLGLAQSLLHDPKVLILDEPTNGLDPAGIREIRDHLRMLARERNMAVIVSSHLLSEMEMMCDRIGIIQEGKLVDVQLVKDFVAVEQVFEIELNPVDTAINYLKNVYPDVQMTSSESGISLTVTRDKIPEIIKTLVLQDFRIFGIKEVSKTLEDRFLELTNQGEGQK
ncbi:ABC transporter ATP-binding protein [Cytobacillus oceanisediminis]|uniref:ABC transporter ATP-binding protein n=1 Tax=Bacillaceae TaxID=186817 RepID=UPI000C787F22|nr:MULTISPECIES: ABC transporter ATP-binding protein [Bacillaceae]MBQ6446928.1 ABC transporter ATP-binding protein [Bacillus sp. (in: firmicutes)]MBZ9536388.1 ABC transporter ATP-binding protein [Cytobacillus oceanisediminis]MED3791120.1 ABC transporter ATP-binding protein [Niallia alba]